MQSQPISQRNWSAFNSDKLETYPVSEVRLYTDAYFVGDAREIGPYSFVNTLAHASHSSRNKLKPAIALRVKHCLSNEPPDMKIANFDHYHGGNLFDELAAMASLILGVRLLAGPIDREFGFDNDPFGTPRAMGYFSIPMLPQTDKRPQIPRLVGERNLSILSSLKGYTKMSGRDATAVVKSARLYQQAIWIADSNPELSWLLLVSSIEAAAANWDEKTNTPLDRLKISYPQMIELLNRKGAIGLAEEIATILKGTIGATGKFTNFLAEFAPGPLDSQPTLDQFSFEKASIKNAANIIYKYRSKALHGGIPFPRPMCTPPMDWRDSEFKGIQEVPGGLASNTLGATWMSEDTPMLLHVCEHIVREALLNWINSIIVPSLEPRTSN